MSVNQLLLLTTIIVYIFVEFKSSQLFDFYNFVDTWTFVRYTYRKVHGVARVRTNILQLMGQKQAAEKRVINQAIVAEEAELSRQTINKWVNGDLRRFDEETILKLCKYFGCAMNDLLYIDTEAQ
jgi:DNA-binding Xre family transcriptional regulator